MTPRNLEQRLQRQARRCYRLPLYRRLFDAVGVKPADLRSLADLAAFPLVTRTDIIAAFRNDPPHGGFLTRDVVRIHYTPSPGLGLMPVYFTKSDAAAQRIALASLLRGAGVTAADLVQNAFGYHPFPAGLILHEGCEQVGAKAVAIGPGNTELHVRTMNTLGSTVLIANPSFALKVAEAGGRGIRLFIGGGELFTGVEGYRGRVRRAFGGDITVLDMYGLAEAGVVAMECPQEAGLHVEESFVLAEVVDPETGRPVAEGERGELVLTHLDREAMPLFRFRTGDLVCLVRRPCPCGRSATLPSGILGRVDNMVKIKGVKFYPSELGRVLAGVPGLEGSRHQVVIESDGGVDRVTLRIQGKAGQADAEVVRERFRSTFSIGLNELEWVPDLGEVPLVEDRRPRTARGGRMAGTG